MRRVRKLEKVNEQRSDNKELKKDDVRVEDNVVGRPQRDQQFQSRDFRDGILQKSRDPGIFGIRISLNF